MSFTLACDLIDVEQVTSSGIRTVPSLPTTPSKPALQNVELETIEPLAKSARDWLVNQALPIWWQNGFDWDAGIWNESLDRDGAPTTESRRARVQGRQTFVFSQLRSMDIPGPWDVLVQAGFDGITRHYCDSEGLLRTLLSADAQPIDNATKLYDQTFVLLALASTRHLKPTAHVWAQIMLGRINEKFRNRNGAGYVENCDKHPFQSNAHMHLFEAAIAWAVACREDGLDGRVWENLADEIAQLVSSAGQDANSPPNSARSVLQSQWSIPGGLFWGELVSVGFIEAPGISVTGISANDGVSEQTAS